MRTTLTALLTTALMGCASYSSNMHVGNSMSYTSLGDQRTASQAIQVLQEAPKGATSVGQVEASRCHRSFVEEAPTEAAVLTDLKIAAYALGADAISGVSVEKQSGLTANCWYVLNGKAFAWRLPKGD